MGISTQEFARRFPLLYHMAEFGSWPSIRQHGLLSTSALLDLYEVAGAQREALEARHRPECQRIYHDAHGSAVIRDQKPMTEAGLHKSLRDDLSPREWYEILNEKVFFWVTKERLQKLLGAGAYRKRRHTVLTVDTRGILEGHEQHAVLSPINSGATKPNPQPRGRDTFKPLDAYPFDEWNRKRHGRDPVVELAMTHSVPDIEKFVIRVENRGGGQPTETIWEPDW